MLLSVFSILTGTVMVWASLIGFSESETTTKTKTKTRGRHEFVEDHFTPYVFEVDEEETGEEEDNGFQSRRKNVEESTYIVPDNYSIYAPPPSYGKPIYVETSVVIFNVRDINEVNQDYNLEINLRLYWRDERLTPEIRNGKPYMILNQRLLSKIWTPDIFIDHVKNVSQPILISRPSSLRLYDDSTVRYSTRMTIKMSCSMNFLYYPADTQICNVDFRSFAFDVRDLTLGWRDGVETKILANFRLQSYDIDIHEIKSFKDETPNKRTYWVLRLAIKFQRKMYYHMLQTYCPSVLFVIISWLSFWVPPETVSARMTICITTLLTLTTMFGVVRNSTPNESYAKALDIWMLSCMIFVFATLVEYAVILKLRSTKPKKKKKEPPIDPRHDRHVEGRHIKWRSLFDKLSSSVTMDSEDEPKVTTISYLSWYYNDGKEFVPYHIRRPKLRSSRNSSPMTSSTQTTNSDSPSPLHSFSQSTQTTAAKALRNNMATDQHHQHDGHQKDDESEESPNKYLKLAAYVDTISWILIPGSFLLFNTIYWPWLLISSNNYA